MFNYQQQHLQQQYQQQPLQYLSSSAARGESASDQRYQNQRDDSFQSSSLGQTMCLGQDQYYTDDVLANSSVYNHSAVQQYPSIPDNDFKTTSSSSFQIPLTFYKPIEILDPSRINQVADRPISDPSTSATPSILNNVLVPHNEHVQNNHFTQYVESNNSQIRQSDQQYISPYLNPSSNRRVFLPSFDDRSSVSSSSAAIANSYNINSEHASTQKATSTYSTDMYTNTQNSYSNSYNNSNSNGMSNNGGGSSSSSNNQNVKVMTLLQNPTAYKSSYVSPYDSTTATAETSAVKTMATTMYNTQYISQIPIHYDDFRDQLRPHLSPSSSSSYSTSFGPGIHQQNTNQQSLNQIIQPQPEPYHLINDLLVGQQQPTSSKQSNSSPTSKRSNAQSHRSNPPPSSSSLQQPNEPQHEATKKSQKSNSQRDPSSNRSLTYTNQNQQPQGTNSNQLTLNIDAIHSPDGDQFVQSPILPNNLQINALPSVGIINTQPSSTKHRINHLDITVTSTNSKKTKQQHQHNRILTTANTTNPVASQPSSDRLVSQNSPAQTQLSSPEKLVTAAAAASLANNSSKINFSSHSDKQSQQQQEQQLQQSSASSFQAEKRKKSKKKALNTIYIDMSSSMHGSATPTENADESNDGSISRAIMYSNETKQLNNSHSSSAKGDNTRHPSAFTLHQLIESRSDETDDQAKFTFNRREQIPIAAQQLRNTEFLEKQAHQRTIQQSSLQQQVGQSPEMSNEDSFSGLFSDQLQPFKQSTAVASRRPSFVPSLKLSYNASYYPTSTEPSQLQQPHELQYQQLQQQINQSTMKQSRQRSLNGSLHHSLAERKNSEAIGTEMSSSKQQNGILKEQVIIIQNRIQWLQRTPSTVHVAASRHRSESRIRTEVAEMRESRVKESRVAREEHQCWLESRQKTIQGLREHQSLIKQRKSLSALYRKKSATEIYCLKLIEQQDKNTAIQQQIENLQAQEAYLVKRMTSHSLERVNKPIGGPNNSSTCNRTSQVKYATAKSVLPTKYAQQGGQSHGQDSAQSKVVVKC